MLITYQNHISQTKVFWRCVSYSVICFWKQKEYLSSGFSPLIQTVYQLYAGRRKDHSPVCKSIIGQEKMNEANKRKTENKRHQHIPVVYYEGKKAWTADRHFRGRIAKDNLFQDWIPDFCYEVVRIHDYSNEELLERGNEMSLIMLFNKIQDTVDLAEFLKLPQDKLDRKVKDTPETVLDVIVSVMESLCMKVGASEEETEECVQKVKERKMGYMFEHMEKMNIQEERRKTAKAEKWAQEAEQKA